MRQASPWFGLRGWLVALVGIVASLYMLRDARPPRQESHANVVIVVNDTMRRDVLGAYGGSVETPSFDAFAREHLLFERAYAQAPWTIPSVASLFTGLYPSQHGTLSHPVIRKRAGGVGREVKADALAHAHRTLAEVLWDAGYETGAFVSNPWLRSGMGFAQGFADYDESFVDEWRHDRQSEMTRRAVDWIASRNQERAYFLYVHYLSSHRPFEPLSLQEARDISSRHSAQAEGPWPAGSKDPGRYREKRMAPDLVVTLEDGRRLSEAGLEADIHHVRVAYQKGAARFDRELGVLLEALERDADWDRTIVLVLSDHGEALYERGPYGSHGTDLFEEQIAVPLAARFPGVDAHGTRSDALVGLVDLLPTLCVELELDCPAELGGQDIFGPPRSQILAEGVMSAPSHRAVIAPPYKLIREDAPPEYARYRRRYPQLVLFDLQRDPGERIDRLAEVEASERVATAAMRRLLDEPLFAGESPAATQVTLGDAEIERLQALGYLQ